jgi:hypothetical protein
MTADTLKSYTLKDLAKIAKQRGVNGWQSMRKEQLVKALVRVSKTSANSRSAKIKAAPVQRSARTASGRVATTTARATSSSRAAAAARAATSSRVAVKTRGKVKAAAARSLAVNGAAARAKAVKAKAAPVVVAKARKPGALKKLEEARSKAEQRKNLASFRSPNAPNGFTKDRLVVMVRDPFWLHAYWELTRQGVERAQAAMGQEWHAARPVLRLLEVSTGGTANSAEMVLRTIEIHGGVNNWYVDVNEPKSYRLDVGYVSASGKFFLLARSNIVSTPKAGASDAIDENWSHVAENFDKIYALSGGYSGNGSIGDLQELFEERLRRPMGSPITTRYGVGLNGFDKKRDFHFELDAELIVYGSTEPDAHVTLQGDPVKLRPDGTFTVRFSMPNCRQVIPAVASSADGMEQRTVVLAVERNTKVMEPLVRDNND